MAVRKEMRIKEKKEDKKGGKKKIEVKTERKE